MNSKKTDLGGKTKNGSPVGYLYYSENLKRVAQNLTGSHAARGLNIAGVGLDKELIDLQDSVKYFSVWLVIPKLPLIVDSDV